jgi:hypothetical protein
MVGWTQLPSGLSTEAWVSLQTVWGLHLTAPFCANEHGTSPNYGRSLGHAQLGEGRGVCLVWGEEVHESVMVAGTLATELITCHHSGKIAIGGKASSPGLPFLAHRGKW